MNFSLKKLFAITLIIALGSAHRASAWRGHGWGGDGVGIGIGAGILGAEIGAGIADRGDDYDDEDAYEAGERAGRRQVEDRRYRGGRRGDY